eukprot:COSAG02_NODE_4624_length_5152_cov_23.466653_1_plen_114_part_10
MVHILGISVGDLTPSFKIPLISLVIRKTKAATRAGPSCALYFSVSSQYRTGFQPNLRYVFVTWPSGFGQKDGRGSGSHRHTACGWMADISADDFAGADDSVEGLPTAKAPKKKK